MPPATTGMPPLPPVSNPTDIGLPPNKPTTGDAQNTSKADEKQHDTYHNQKVPTINVTSTKPKENSGSANIKTSHTVVQREIASIAETLIDLSNTDPSAGTVPSNVVQTSERPSAKPNEGEIVATNLKRKVCQQEIASIKSGATSKTVRAAPESKSEAKWNQRLAELQQFKILHGHTNVPQKYEKNPSLGAWIARNRMFMRQWEEDPTSLSAIQAGRIQTLKLMGLQSGIGKGAFMKTTGLFMSSKNLQNWENQFKALQEYKAAHGDCDVPLKYEANKPLGRWVSGQRKKYREHSLETTTNKSSNDLIERFQRLKEIGFNFVVGSGNANGNLKRVKVLQQIALTAVEDQNVTTVQVQSAVAGHSDKCETNPTNHIMND